MFPSSFAALAYTPFVQPLPIWAVSWGWAALLLPLCAGVSVVYKSVKCSTMSRVPREATEIFLYIVLGMIAAAAALTAIVRLMQS